VQSYLNYTQAEATSEAELKQLGVLLVEVRHPSFFPAFFWLLYNKYVLYSTFPHKKKEARVSESSKLAK